MGANLIPEATELQELQDMFKQGGFLLRKWKSNVPAVLSHLTHELLDQWPSQDLPANNFTKVLGVEWSGDSDSFRQTPNIIPSAGKLSKRELASNIVQVYDILAWFLPTVIKVKVLLQSLWNFTIKRDDLVPSEVQGE